MEHLGKILIVDDNKNNIQVLGNILRDNGYSVGFAIHGQQALQILRGNPEFDLILLDVEMPVMNGFDTCGAIQQDFHLHEIPVIFLTAFTDLNKVITGFELGGKDYITKPFNEAELLARVHTHVELKQYRDRLKDVNYYLEEKVAERTHELEKSNKELADTRKELEVLDRSKTEFLQMLSHEIRTPLNGIVGPLGLVNRSELSEESKELLEILDMSVSRLERFSYKALDIMELRMQESESPRLEKLMLSEIFDSSLVAQRDRIKEKNINVTVHIEPATLCINAISSHLRRCLTYLLENAIYHSPAGSTIQIEARKMEDRVSLQVTDEGPGFPAKILNTSLSPFLFYRREDGQTGLGLYYAHLVMKIHKGFFRYGNHEPKGAQVEMVFPVNDNKTAH